MTHRFSLVTIAAFLALSGSLRADTYRDELREVSEDLRLSEKTDLLERALTDAHDSVRDDGYLLRSPHFLFGKPRPIDRRYDLSRTLPGLSLLVREGFVVGYFERMRCPIWVCQRWSADDLEDKDNIPSMDRDWREDPDLPSHLRAGTSYDGNKNGLDRGHMAKHSMNRAWGADSSINGCLMSNSVPQHKAINRRSGGWWFLEEEIENLFRNDEVPCEAVWTCSGALFRDDRTAPGEGPRDDFVKVARIAGGFGVPFATYKIVCWFEEEGDFQARGYVFEQPYAIRGDGTLAFEIPDQNRPLKKFLVPIDEIEERVGLDFFPHLADSVEDKVEAARFGTIWGSD